MIIDICDKAGVNSKNAKDCIRSILKRLGNNDPHVAIQAITVCSFIFWFSEFFVPKSYTMPFQLIISQLLDACIKNCGRIFHLEIASRDFETEFQRLMTKTTLPVAQKMRTSLKKWAENEFKTNHELTLIPSLYHKLKSDGLDFNESASEKSKISINMNKEPNTVSNKQEDEDIAKGTFYLQDKSWNLFYISEFLNHFETRISTKMSDLHDDLSVLCIVELSHK